MERRKRPESITSDEPDIEASQQIGWGTCQPRDTEANLAAKNEKRAK
jgi:hypothetical protein